MSAVAASYSTLVFLLPVICSLPYYVRYKFDLGADSSRLNAFNLFMAYGFIRAIYYLLFWFGIDSLETIIIFAVISSLIVIHAFARILQAWVTIIYLASNLSTNISSKVKRNFHIVEMAISFIVVVVVAITAYALNQHLVLEELVEHTPKGTKAYQEAVEEEHLYSDYVVTTRSINIYVISILFVFCGAVAVYYTHRALPIIDSLNLPENKKRGHKQTFTYLLLAALILFIRAGRTIYVVFAYPPPDVGHAASAARFAIDPETIPSHNYAELTENNYPWAFWTELFLVWCLYNILFTTMKNHPKLAWAKTGSLIGLAISNIVADEGSSSHLSKSSSSLA